MTKKTVGGAKPRIILTAADHEKLSVLANAAAHTMPEVAAELAEELDRAQVLSTGRRRRVSFPHWRAGISSGRAPSAALRCSNALCAREQFAFSFPRQTRPRPW